MPGFLQQTDHVCIILFNCICICIHRTHRGVSGDVDVLPMIFCHIIHVKLSSDELGGAV